MDRCGAFGVGILSTAQTPSKGQTHGGLRLQAANDIQGDIMSGIDIRSAKRAEPDQVLVDIADYVCETGIDSDLAYETAHYCLMDTLACGFQALDYPACTKMLGPVVPGATLAGGSRVPGTSYELDPVLGAFNIGAMIRWLDFNDTWLAAEWGHPSDNLGGQPRIVSWQCRTRGRFLESSRSG